jgi:capsular polysaccharide transport system ATP-binding protein
MIRFDGVTKSFRRHGGLQVLLNQVSFTLPRGRRLGVLGRNGAGKSTLLRIIAGSEPIDSGRITRHGRVSFPVGFTGTFHPSLTARQNLQFLADVYNMDRAEITDWVEDFSDIGAYFDMPVGTCSSGMFARLAFGTSFAFEFDTYLVDEAFETGDEAFRARCTVAFEARLRDASLVLVSQNIETIRRHCDCAAVLDGGQLSLYADIDSAIDVHADIMRRQLFRATS